MQCTDQVLFQLEHGDEIKDGDLVQIGGYHKVGEDVVGKKWSIKYHNMFRLVPYQEIVLKRGHI